MDSCSGPIGDRSWKQLPITFGPSRARFAPIFGPKLLLPCLSSLCSCSVSSCRLCGSPSPVLRRGLPAPAPRGAVCRVSRWRSCVRAGSCARRVRACGDLQLVFPVAPALPAAAAAAAGAAPSRWRSAGGAAVSPVAPGTVPFWTGFPSACRLLSAGRPPGRARRWACSSARSRGASARAPPARSPAALSSGRGLVLWSRVVSALPVAVGARRARLGVAPRPPRLAARVCARGPAAGRAFGASRVVSGPAGPRASGPAAVAAVPRFSPAALPRSPSPAVRVSRPRSACHAVAPRSARRQPPRQPPLGARRATAARRTHSPSLRRAPSVPVPPHPAAPPPAPPPRRTSFSPALSRPRAVLPRPSSPPRSPTPPQRSLTSHAPTPPSPPHPPPPPPAYRSHFSRRYGAAQRITM